jgi:hypothetical protein
VSVDEQHVALPKLYGAPAYARPPRVASEAERPFDPDELPIEADRTDEEHDFMSALPAHAYAPGGIYIGNPGHTDAGQDQDLRPRTFSLRSIAGRLRGN